MKKTAYTCQVLTPMFLAGANKNEPELRAASIKGVMRYFYRAIQCESSGSDLYKKEKRLLGGVSGDEGVQSGLRIQVGKAGFSAASKEMLPHRPSGGMPQRAIPEGTEFEVILRSFGENEKNHTTYEALFELTVLLGGFGRRSRRGMGSVMIMSKNGQACPLPESLLDNVFVLLNRLSRDIFTMDAGAGVIKRTRRLQIHYPYIEEIHETVKKSSALEFAHHYGQASHRIRRSAPNGFRLTGSINPRYASPVYCTVASPSQGFIVKLHVKHAETPHEVHQRHFIDDAKS